MQVRGLKLTFSKFDKKLTEIKVSAPELNTLPLKMILTEGINRMQKIVAAQPKQVLHEKRILFFPEWNQKEYYKIIFGRILFWILCVIVAAYCYFLCRDFVARY
jgi:hypothetical protein